MSARHRFTDTIQVRCPPALPNAIDQAATRQMKTTSEYVRQSVLERLRADGIDLTAITEAA